MATTYKVLGQAAPAVATNTDLYQVPGSTQAIVSTITVSNTTSVIATYRIAIRLAGEALSTKNYISYDSSLAANDSIAITVGATLRNATGSLGTGDIVTVYSATGGVSITAFGTELN
jgi:NADPH:quinone reductase-like Zn-dependent oxidoreductase